MKSFEEILREKMTQGEDSPQGISQAKSNTFSPRAEWNPYEIPRFSFNQPNTRIYPHKDKGPRPSQPEVQWTPDHLPEEIAAAYRFFHKQGEKSLTDRCALGALKKAFRRQARNLHPDRFASANEALQKQKAALFRDLRRHYETLLIFLDQKAKAA